MADTRRTHDGQSVEMRPKRHQGGYKADNGGHMAEKADNGGSAVKADKSRTQCGHTADTWPDMLRGRGAASPFS